VSPGRFNGATGGDRRRRAHCRPHRPLAIRRRHRPSRRLFAGYRRRVLWSHRTHRQSYGRPPNRRQRSWCRRLRCRASAPKRDSRSRRQPRLMCRSIGRDRTRRVPRSRLWGINVSSRTAEQPPQNQKRRCRLMPCLGRSCTHPSASSPSSTAKSCRLAMLCVTRASSTLRRPLCCCATVRAGCGVWRSGRADESGRPGPPREWNLTALSTVSVILNPCPS
jgi:hypothetical protein